MTPRPSPPDGFRVPPRESRTSPPRVAQPAPASRAFHPGESRIPPGRVPRPIAASPVDGHAAPASGHDDLAARQAALVAALVADGPVPAGFDPERLAVARRALVRKRAGAAAVRWPLLAPALGPDWPAAVAASVEGRPPVDALDDGWRLARARHRRRGLGPAAVVELAEREVTLRRTRADPPVRRRLPAARWTGHGLVVQVAGRVLHLPRA